MNVPLGVLRPPAPRWQPPPTVPAMPVESDGVAAGRALRRASGALARRHPEGRPRSAGAPPPAIAPATGPPHPHRRRGSRRGLRRCRRRSSSASSASTSVALLAWNVPTRRRRAVGAADRRQQTVARGWFRSCPAGRRSPPGYERGSQRRGRRIGASCDIGVDERPHRRWQQVLDRGQRPMPFYGEVSPGQRRAPREPAHDVGIQASGCEERRLHGDRLDLLTRCRCWRRRRPPSRRSTPARRARQPPPAGRGSRSLKPASSAARAVAASASQLRRHRLRSGRHFAFRAATR